MAHKYWTWKFKLNLTVIDPYWATWSTFLNVNVVEKIKKIKTINKPLKNKNNKKVKIIHKWKKYNSKNNIKKNNYKNPIKTNKKKINKKEKIWDLNYSDLKFWITTSSFSSKKINNFTWIIKNLNNWIIYLKWWTSVELENKNKLFDELKFSKWTEISISNDWSIDIINDSNNNLNMNKLSSKTIQNNQLSEFTNKENNLINSFFNLIEKLINWFTFIFK